MFVKNIIQAKIRRRVKFIGNKFNVFGKNPAALGVIEVVSGYIEVFSEAGYHSPLYIAGKNNIEILSILSQRGQVGRVK
jgi:hypothetical protein